MRLTNSEKLILTMLAEIHEKLEIRDGIDTKCLGLPDPRHLIGFLPSLWHER